jgi:hypothetical protein
MSLILCATRAVREHRHQIGKGEDSDGKQLERGGGGGAVEGSSRRRDVGGVQERTATRERGLRATTIGPGGVEAGEEGASERIKISRTSSLPDSDMAPASKSAFRAGVHGATTGALHGGEDTSNRQERENASAEKRQSRREDKEERKRAAAGKACASLPVTRAAIVRLFRSNLFSGSLTPFPPLILCLSASFACSLYPWSPSPLPPLSPIFTSSPLLLAPKGRDPQCRFMIGASGARRIGMRGHLPLPCEQTGV